LFNSIACVTTPISSAKARAELPVLAALAAAKPPSPWRDSPTTLSSSACQTAHRLRICSSNFASSGDDTSFS